MGTLQRSIALARAAWAVLRQDKELAVLPILSFAAWLVIAATFALPIAAIAAGPTGATAGPRSR